MQQETALRILESGRNVFLTGAPGAGKTYTLNQFISDADDDGKTIAITASTGIAATHLDGRTLQSWSGLGINDSLTDAIMARIRRWRATRIRETQILVIDEISMLDARTFDLVERVCRRIRHDDRPFGGMQVVMSGDFYQLPPVADSKEKRLVAPTDEYETDTRRYLLAGLDPNGFITESFAWKAMQPTVCYLTEQHRQENGPLLRTLIHIREGHVDADDRYDIQRRVGLKPDPDVHAVHMFPVNAQADRVNTAKLAEITAEPHRYEAMPSGDKKYAQRIMQNMLAPQHLVLKEGATVMAVKNDPDRRYVNGSIGVIEGFVDGYPAVRFSDGETVVMRPDVWEMKDGEYVLASVSQVPLRCAWAITIHKSQGMSLENAVMDLSRTFAPGMGYVALSRVESFDGLYLQGINDRAYLVSEEATRLDGMLRERSKQAECEFQNSMHEGME